MAGAQKSANGFRSLMEARIIPRLLSAGARYEPIRLRYQGKPRGYVPDVVLPNGIVVEIKGWFTPSDRSKMLAVKAQFSYLDLRLVLASPNQKLGSGSKTTQAAWCEKYGFPWAAGDVPSTWLAEPPNVDSQRIIAQAPDTTGRRAREERNAKKRLLRIANRLPEVATDRPIDEPALEGADA